MERQVVSHVDTTKAGIGELRHLSLCSGYGGIDLGLRRVLPACRTVAYVEIEAFAIWNLVQKMEKGYLDAAPVWTNLKTMPLAQLREVLGRESIISGGFPCQPFSVAGAKAGDEDPRHLFPYIVDAVRTIQPRWVFLENVEGIISSKLKSDNWADPAGTPVLLHVLRELERLGYRAEAGVFSASEVGLPHQRKRVFILAYSINQRLERGICRGQDSQWEDQYGYAGRSSAGIYRRGVAPARPGQQQYPWEPPRVISASDQLADSECSRLRGGRSSEECGDDTRWFQGNEGERNELRSETEGCSGDPRERAELGDTNSHEQTQKPRDSSQVPKVSSESGEEQCSVVSGGAGTGEPELGNSKHDGLSTTEIQGGVEEAGTNYEERPIQASKSSGAGKPRSVSNLREEPELGNSDTGRQLQQEGDQPEGRGWDSHTGSASDQRQTEPQMGGNYDGATDWLDYAQLCSSVDNRIDELRLLGNGVVPATAAKAFTTLYERIING